MLPARFTSVLDARSVDDLLRESLHFARGLECGWVNTMAVVDHPFAGPDFIAVHNTPPAAVEEFSDWGKVDPVMQHCKHRSLPIVWSQHTYVSKGLGHLWEAQHKYGYHSGIALALHLPRG